MARAYCTHSLCGGTALSTLPCHVAFCCITQMWMSVLWRGLALTDNASTWMALSAVPATGVMTWHLMGRAAKVLGSHVSRHSEVSHTQSRGFPRLSLSTWLSLSPGHRAGWFPQPMCPWSWLLCIFSSYPTLLPVFMQTLMNAHPGLPVPPDSASILRAPIPACLVTPAMLSPEMAACVKVSLPQEQRSGC